MGGIISGSAETFYDYGWVKRACSTIRSENLRALCIFDCDSPNPVPTVDPTTSEATTEAAVTTTEPDNYNNQKLAYTVYTTNMLYINSVGVNGIEDYSESYTMPYTCFQTSTSAPYVVYNSDRNVIEVMGNFHRDFNCSQHYFFKNKQFQLFSGSLYTSTKLASIVNVPTVGTISIGGYNTEQKKYVKDVRVVTPSTTLQPLTSRSYNYLKSFPGTAYFRMAATVDKNVVYVVGGKNYPDSSTYSNQIYSIDFNDINTYDDAKQRSWKFLDNLSDGVYGATVQLYDSQLFVAGNTYGNPNDITAGNVYTYNLVTGQLGTYKTVYDSKNTYGTYCPGSFIHNGNMTLFGGLYCPSTCVQQDGNLNQVGQPWSMSCVDSKYTKLGGFTSGSARVWYTNIFGDFN